MEAADLFSAQSVCLSILLALFCSFVIRKLNSRNEKNNLSKLPPLYAGWLPWIGCALEFGKAPVFFIEEKQKELGPVYTLLIAGERMTFLLDPDDFQHFFQSSNVDFQKAVQSAVQRVASVTETSFFAYHTKIHDMVKGKLAITKLPPLFPKLQQSFAHKLDGVKSSEDCDLLQLVRGVMYQAIIDNLFGEGTLPTTDRKSFEELEQHFVKFDDQFEYGSKLPSFLLRDWMQSKRWLLELFSCVVRRLKPNQTNEEGTMLQSLLEVVDSQHSPNYSLLLLWASLANAIPITFWAIAFILSDGNVLKKAKDEVSRVLGTSKEVNETHLSAMPYLKCCTLEAIRLRSPGIITRKVIKSFTVKNYTVPAGDRLMISPFWAHRNPDYFPNPDSFQPERWQQADLEKNGFLNGFIGFGGGRYQCPGRWFALMEIHLFLAMFLQRFNCQLLGKVPELSSTLGWNPAAFGTLPHKVGSLIVCDHLDGGYLYHVFEK